jgi:hypothetical protein
LVPQALLGVRVVVQFHVGCSLGAVEVVLVWTGS